MCCDTALLAHPLLPVSHALVPYLPRVWQRNSFATGAITPHTITLLAACLECGGENLQPLLSHPLLSHPHLPRIWQQDSFETTAIFPHVITPLRYILPRVVNNLKSQTTTHFITGGARYTTPPRYTTPGDKIPKPKILSPGGVVYAVIHGTHVHVVPPCPLPPR